MEKFKENVQTFRERAFKAIESEKSVEQSINALNRVLAEDGAAKFIAYHSSRLGARPSVDPYIRLTYPASWIKRYLTRGYIDVDPVVREGFSRSLAFDWTEIEIISEAEKAFFEDAAEHEVGVNGLSIPLIGRYGHRGLFSISSDLPFQEWSEWWRPKISDLLEIGHCVHKTAISRVIGGEVSRLPPRSLECLEWMSRGKTMSETATILNLSENTVRAYLRTARHKLNTANTSQAISKAIELGFIRPDSQV
ncbi:autoinducer binding domain-containing protein [Pseudahrensia aquimaris]|uniref:Autoinducer binding domain-containing protein n=1 Tax=Pseudahrensia aquimaris TaxID=744461 RepID=A0ABW3FD87_9HYPH